jgi:apolipoprotein N-acyltransferase
VSAVAAPPPGASPAARPGGLLVEVLLALAMGTWVLAFTPQPVAIAALPAFVAALALIERCATTKRAVLWILLFGAVAIGYGYRWLAATVREFGDLDARMPAAAAVAVSWLVLALYGVVATVHGVVFVLAHRWMLRRGDRRPHPLATVLLLVACEALPIRFLPWMVGYGAVDVPPLRQAAEWGGVHAVSFAVLCLVTPFHEWLRWALAREGPPARPRAAAVTFAIGLALYAAGAWRARDVAREDAAAERTLRVGIVQANVGSRTKRLAERERREEARTSRRLYEEGTREAAARGAALVLWPETALDSVRLWDPVRGRARPEADVSRSLRDAGYGFLEEVGRDRALLLGGYADEPVPGAPRRADGREEMRRYNAAMLRPPGGGDWSIYRKVKLIPFGERMPIPGLEGLLPQHVPMAAGTLPQPPLVWRREGGDLEVVAFVCYEDVLPGFVATLAQGGRPDLLVNLTNDSWFGDTWEPHQHLNFARFRAVEHRLPLVRSTNTGVSAVVDATGEVVERLGVNVRGTLVRDVPLVRRPRTLWAVVGPHAVWVLVALGVLAVASSRFPGRTR